MSSEKIQGKRAGIFIVSEGLDCSGKTTSIKAAIGIIGEKAAYSKGLCSGTFAGRMASRFPSTFLFLIEQIYLTYFVIKPKLRKGKIVLQDRYFISIASHLPSAAKLHNRLLIKAAKPFLLAPDILVHFNVSEKERIKRLKQNPYRHHAELIEKPWLIALREEAYKRHYRGFNGRKAVIDTTNNSREESGEALSSLLKRKLRKPYKRLV